MHIGATSTDRIIAGSDGDWGPPTSATLNESNACSAPCDPPPTCALPPRTLNSQPGCAVSHTSPPPLASSAPAIRSNAFGYSLDWTTPSCTSSCSVSGSPRQHHPVPNASRPCAEPSSLRQNSSLPRWPLAT